MPPSSRLAAAALFALFAAACSSTSVPPPPVADPAALAPPPQGAGVQLKTDDFAVPAGAEIQRCYFFKVSDLEQSAGLPSDQPIELHRIQIVQRAGSHHMNVFRVRTIHDLGPPAAPPYVVAGQGGQGPCFKSSNWADWPLVANTQQGGEQDWAYPDGVANELAPGEWLMLQTHYVNASTQATPGDGGQVAVNFWTLPKAQVTAQIGTLFATNQHIRICQGNPTPLYSSSCQFHSPKPVTIIGANGHFHSRGKEFDMYLWDGISTVTPDASARFYQSKNWDEPPMLHSPQLELSVPANAGVWYSCSYQWQQPPSAIGCGGLDALDGAKGTPASQQNCCYTFGGIVDENEHCNAFVYYYPKQDDVTCE